MDRLSVELANKLYIDLSMGIEASSVMVDKVKNNYLKQYLNSHVNKYGQLQDEIERQLKRSNKKPKDTNIVSKSFLWMQSQLSSLRKSEDEEFVESFIKGSDMGAESGEKLLGKYKNAQIEVRKIVEEFIELEKDNVKRLKEFKKSLPN